MITIYFPKDWNWLKVIQWLYARRYNIHNFYNEGHRFFGPVRKYRIVVNPDHTVL